MANSGKTVMDWINMAVIQKAKLAFSTVTTSPAPTCNEPERR